MNCADFKSLLIDCLENGRDPASRADARGHLETCPACRRDAAELPLLWERLPAADPGDPPGEPSSQMRQRFAESLDTLREARKLPGRPVKEPGVGDRVIVGPWNRALAIALAATLAIGVALGLFFGGRLSTSAEIRELRAEMQSVNEVVGLALMTHDSASERLRGIALSSGRLPDANSGDARVIEALFERLRNDPNDNVRLAAVEALGSAVNLAEVRDGLFACIAAQESQEVQAAVLETLARSDRSAFSELLASEQLDDDVRQWFLVTRPPHVG